MNECLKDIYRHLLAVLLSFLEFNFIYLRQEGMVKIIFWSSFTPPHVISHLKDLLSFALHKKKKAILKTVVNNNKAVLVTRDF